MKNKKKVIDIKVNNRMKILLCSVPDGSLERTLTPLLPRGKVQFKVPIRPLGVLRILAGIEKYGYSSDIYDINNLRPSDEKLTTSFKRVNPTVVGLSAPLSHCYPNTKRIAKLLRKLFPDIWIVVGGALTASSPVLLHKTETDICVIGDGEIPFVKLLDYFKLHPTRRQTDYTELNKIKGLSFIDENNKLKVTGNAEQLPATELQYPNYDKLRTGLQEFAGNHELVHEFFQPMYTPQILDEDYDLTKNNNFETLKFVKKNINNKMGEIETTKGCVARCTFCQRSSKGYRALAANNDLESHILELKEKYNVRIINIADENSLGNRKQGYEIARIMKKCDVLWTAGGVRCTNVTFEDLKFYKEHNMLHINFGIESGSQRILDIMEKKFTREDVYKTVSNCKKIGLHTNTDSVMLGMPGETRKTCIETAELVASLRYVLENDWNVTKPFLAMAVPGTPLYEYCQQTGVIGKTLEEEEDYLIRISEHKNLQFLNYVNKTGSSDKEVHHWLYLFEYAVKKEYVNLIIKDNKSIKNKLLLIYKKCIKPAFVGRISLVWEYNLRKKAYKNKKLLQKMKWYTILSINLLLSLSVPFLPKAVLFPIVRMYANTRLHFLIKNHKVKKGKQKYNLFADQRVDSAANNLRFTEEKISKTTRRIDRSLRRVVKNNREQMKPVISDEEKGLQILAEGQ